jgi:nitroreductase
MNFFKMTFIKIAHLLGIAAIASASELPEILLPKPQKEGGMPLMQCLEKRESQRSFDKEFKLSVQTLSNLLWAASGVNREDGRRTAPTAMNRQQIDLYMITDEGGYLYEPKDNKLKPIFSGDIRPLVGKQGFVADAPVILFYVSDHDKMLPVLTKEQKDFYSATDAGFISQNVYLFCASEGLSTVVLGMLEREIIKEKFKLTNSQFVILGQPVAYPLPE